MSRARKQSRVAAILLLAVFVAGAAEAEGERGRLSGFYEKLVDLVIVRPLGLVPIVVAPVGCALGLPVALANQSPVEPFAVCLGDPLAYTFRRPLGEF